MITFADRHLSKDFDNLKRQFANASSKREQMMLNGVGKGGVEWHQSKATPREMEFLDGLEANKETIWSVLAPGMASMLSPSSNEANARVGEAIFTNKTVWPWLTELASKLNLSLMPFFGDNLISEFEDIRITDRALELQEMQQAEKFHTIDEIRKEYYLVKPIGDERGGLLLAEIGSQSGNGGDEVSEDVTVTAQDASVDQSRPEDVVDEQEPVKSELEVDLDKWRRKASKRIGESVPFESKHIPYAMKRHILNGLEECVDKASVKAIFDSVLEAEPEPKKNDDMSGLMAMLDSAIKAIDEEKPAPQPQQPQSADQIINVTIPAKSDMSAQELAAAFAAAIGSIPAPQVNVRNDVQPSTATIQAGDVVVNVPAQEKPNVEVNVNLKQVEKMKTKIKRNDKGEATALETDVTNG